MRALALALACACVLLGRASAQGDAVDFGDAMRGLSAVAACDGGPVDARFDAAAVRAHCAGLDALLVNYERRWAKPARPFFEALVPADTPTTVVYPFGGADLLTALAVFPRLEALTSISLEAGGDPRSFSRTPPGELLRHLALHRKFLSRLVRFNHSRTLDLLLLKGTPLPSQLIFALIGLKAHGYEPVGLHAVRLGAGGQVERYTAEDVAAADDAARGLKGSARNRKLNDAFAGYELTFSKRGDAGAPLKTYRHFQANLADDALAKDGRVLAYLRAQGRFAVLTKAASYLLWWSNFETIRGLLLERGAWMVSDSTGVSAVHLDPAVWTQDVYGRFAGTFLKSSAEGQRALLGLYATQPKRPLPFDFFGYPDVKVQGHLVVTRRK
jgi:hypothetical protein